METRILLCEASADEIHRLSGGEVTVPETLNYITFKPVPRGLFCPRIFGQRPGGICLCGRYEHLATRRDPICKHCRVEVVARKVWEEPIGHIDLAVPITLPSQTVVECLSVVSPALRPVFKVGAQQIMVSDLNFLYRRVIIRNNCLKRVLRTRLKNERRPYSIEKAIDDLMEHVTLLLQQSVARLINNRQCPRPEATVDGHTFYSLLDLFSDLSRDMLDTLPSQ